MQAMHLEQAGDAVQEMRLHACFCEGSVAAKGKLRVFVLSSIDCAEHDFGCASLQGAGAAEPEPNFTPLQCLRSLDFWLLVSACIIGALGSSLSGRFIMSATPFREREKESL